MKIADIVTQLKILLPLYTDKFSTNLNIDSISVSGGLATVTTSTPHGLADGNAVSMCNVAMQTPIESVTKDGFIFSFITERDHDLTGGYHKTVTIGGFTDTNWNATFDLFAEPNRRTFKVQSLLDIPVLNGNEYLDEVRIDGFNGQYGISVVDSNTFTVTGDFIDSVYKGGTVASNVRVAGSVSLDRAVDEYTKKKANEFFLFVIGGDVSVSKDRNTNSDALSEQTDNSDKQLLLLDGFILVIVARTSNQLMGVSALDICRHDLRLPLYKSVYGAKFPSGLVGEPLYGVVPLDDGIVDYNKAVLVYSYSFQLPAQITDDDQVDVRNHRAFRDLEYTQVINGEDTLDMTVLPINLDLQPFFP